jgi:hypothetical protein
MPASGDDRGGFSLDSITWGYRDLFDRALTQLEREGAIGPKRPETTRVLYEFLARSSSAGTDHVLKAFLDAMTSEGRWIFEQPAIFTDLVSIGGELADRKLFYGTAFFDAVASGGLGRSPAEARFALDAVRRLRALDDELALGLLRGLPRLFERLALSDIDRYIDMGKTLFARNPESARRFLEGRLQSSATVVESLSRECRLEDARRGMESLLRATTGLAVEVKDLGALDSDDLIERGTRIVCAHDRLYVPIRIADFDDRERNRGAYSLIALLAAGCLSERSFCRIHGHPRYPDGRALAGSDPRDVALFQVAELVRAIRRIRRKWPGARRLLAFGLRAEQEAQPPRTDADRLFFEAAAERPAGPAARLAARADAFDNCFATAAALREAWAEEVAAAYPGLASAPLRTFGFLPDFLFPLRLSAPPSDAVVADLKQRGEPTPNAAADPADRDRARVEDRAGEEGREASDESAPVGAAACFLYDEWSHPDRDYLPNHCRLFESRVSRAAAAAISEDWMDEARRVSRMFERIVPDETRREKYLREGDSIDTDRLVEYMVQRRKEPSPRVRFYEKPRILERDLAVLVLLDCSGSTGEIQEGRGRVIDAEKRAALILGQGLAALGDRFSICGFSTQGPECCRYSIFKDFEDGWDRDALARIMSASPAQSTRIGPALRHSGARLHRAGARRKLLLVVTDGKPTDSGYDPATLYAQYDVRKACEENERLGVTSFGISSNENSVADMEIMFPRSRYAILRDMRGLPRALPRLYLHLTT